MITCKVLNDGRKRETRERLKFKDDLRVSVSGIPGSTVDTSASVTVSLLPSEILQTQTSEYFTAVAAIPVSG